MVAKTEFSPDRFNVDTQGMRQLHESREPEQLVKELIQNVFDEEATRCSVSVQVLDNGVRVIVEDDGPGFRNVRDAYTLMGDTPKRLDPERRGRFNMGEKEVLSVARSAKVETAGSTVEFPEDGGRLVSKNRRQRGTKITALMPWGQREAERLVNRLRMFRPPGDIRYTVNLMEIKRSREIITHSAILDTVIQDAPGTPLRSTRRRTDMQIIEPHEGEGWIYEMGIPIQKIEIPYSVDIMQKVPMPPNRDTVSESYLNRIYTEVLNATHPDMKPEEFSENWVRAGVGHRAVTPEAVKKVISERYGDKVVTWSSNTDANMKATDAGYQVLHPRSMGKEEIKNMREMGSLQSSNEVFGQKNDDEAPELEPERIQQEFARWVKDLGRHAGKEVRPVFVHDETSNVVASCTMNTQNPVMRFNTHHLDGEFFQGRGEKQLDLIVHELGHSEMEGEMSHGPQWGEACCRVAAMVATGLRDARRR